MFKKIKLVRDWRNSWLWFSQQCMLAAVGIQGVWHSLPPELQAAVPDRWVSTGTIAVLVLGMVGRLLDQGLSDEPAKDTPPGQDEAR